MYGTSVFNPSLPPESSIITNFLFERLPVLSANNLPEFIKNKRGIDFNSCLREKLLFMVKIIDTLEEKELSVE